MQEFEAKLGKTLCDHLKCVNGKSTECQRILALFQCVQCLSKAAEKTPPTVYGLSIYKAKTWNARVTSLPAVECPRNVHLTGRLAVK